MSLEIQRLATRNEADLRSSKVQRESGQGQQTTERLDLMDRIYVDGRAQGVVIDRERRVRDIVLKVVPDDATKKDLDVHRLGVRSKELDIAARAFVDELMRRRDAS